MQNQTIKNSLLICLIASISLPAYAADNNNQKRTAGTVDEQNTAATLMQAGAREALARREQQNKSTQQAESTPHTELEKLLMQQSESNTAATLIQAGARGALARHEALAIPVPQNNAYLSTVQLTNATPAASLCSSYSSRSSESSESSEDSDMTPEENIEARDQYGDTPLIWAANMGHVEVARTLINHKANINVANQWGETALMRAAIKGHVEVVRTLIEHGANVNIANLNRITPLIVAAYNDHVELIRILVDRGANVDITNQWGETALIMAANKDHVEIMRILIDRGANVDIASPQGDTPLIVAANKGHIEIVRTLISHATNVDITNRQGNTPLILAADQNHVEIVRMLIGRGANVDIANLGGETALMRAANTGLVEVVQTLINHNANVDIIDQGGDTALMRAANTGHVEAVRMLIDHGANVDIANQFDSTALIMAARNYHIEVVRTLIGRGANIDVSIFELPNFIDIIQSTIELFRSQLTQQHPEDLMEFLLSDLEQFGQNSENTTLEAMGNAFIQVGEIITRDMSSEDRNNFRAGCRLFRKAASNGKNILARSKKIELFIKFITQLRQQFISLKEKHAGEEQIINAVEKVVALLDQKLQQGNCVHRQETQNTDQVTQAALATMGCVTMQQAGPDAAFENTQAACATLNAERALRAQQETEYKQSLATDQRKAALKEQIAKLTQQAQAFMTEYDVYAAPLEIRQQAVAILADIIAARTELISLIQATQICHEVFSQAIAVQLAEQNEACINEQAQLEMIKNAIDSYAPTREEIRAAREQYYGNGKGKGSA